jgi:hypothetical protein
MCINLEEGRKVDHLAARASKIGGLPSGPLKAPLDNWRPDDSPSNFCSKEEHLQLLFEVRSEVEDLKFRIEQLDKRISLLLVLNVCSAHRRPTSDLSAHDAIQLNMPIPLLPSNKDYPLDG